MTSADTPSRVQRDTGAHPAQCRRDTAPVVPRRRVDVIETDSFGSFSVVLGEYGIAERAFELSHASAVLARRVADEYATADRPRFVAGSMGPGTKFPTLGQITYDDLSASYEEMAYGLLEGGVDLLIVETMFDLLSGKAAIAACHRAMVRHGASYRSRPRSPSN